MLSALINGTESVLTMLRINGVNCISTGGETADLGDLVRTVVVDSTVTCRMKKEDVIDNSNIQPGDVIVGLSSSGQATYEVCVLCMRSASQRRWERRAGAAHARTHVGEEGVRDADSATAATLLTDGVQRRHGQQRVDVGAARRARTHVRGQIPRGVRPRSTRGPHLQRQIQPHGARPYDTKPGGFQLAALKGGRLTENFENERQLITRTWSVWAQDVEPESGVEVGKLVLSPTRTYAPIVKALLETLREDIHGMVHCSGGAQTKVLHFVKDVHVIKNQLFDCPPLFKMIQEQSNTDWKVRAPSPTACSV